LVLFESFLCLLCTALVSVGCDFSGTIYRLKG
jgi:hypothetical protein